MTIILTLIAGILFGAINVAFFMFGYHLGTKKIQDDALTVDKTNQEAVKELFDWMKYRG